MNCPYCNKELKPIIGACEDTEYYCQNCDDMTGDEILRNQLTKYKQALDIAINAMKSAGTHNSVNCIARGEDPSKDDVGITINRALNEITELEQKDRK